MLKADPSITFSGLIVSRSESNRNTPSQTKRVSLSFVPDELLQGFRFKNKVAPSSHTLNTVMKLLAQEGGVERLAFSVQTMLDPIKDVLRQLVSESPLKARDRRLLLKLFRQQLVLKSAVFPSLNGVDYDPQGPYQTLKFEIEPYQYRVGAHTIKRLDGPKLRLFVPNHDGAS